MVAVSACFLAGLGIQLACSSGTPSTIAASGSGGDGSGASASTGAGASNSVGAGTTNPSTGVTGVGGMLGIGGSGTTGGDTETPCTSAADCTAPQTCHPLAMVCVDPGGECSAQSDCTGGTSCDTASGTCVPGLTGSPCETDDNCDGTATCTAGACGCSGLANEQELIGGALDIYFVFDRTASMGEDCDYVEGGTPPVNSKACFSTYAFPEYLTNVDPAVQDIRLAFQFMSLPGDGCDGAPYSTALVDLTQLPVAADHQIIQEISAEQFQGGYGTEIEGALNGIATFTTANQVSGREMIGVLMTDGDPNGCDEDVGNLAQIISDHLTATGIRTFIIGMEGASGDRLEQMGVAGGAEPHDDYCSPDAATPCHHWNVGDGSGDAIANALQAIVQQASPLGCEYEVVDLQAPAGETLDYGKVNVTLTEAGITTTIGQVADLAACPTDQPAWYYDSPGSPSQLLLCDSACTMATSAVEGSRLDIVVGCEETVPIEEVQ